MRFTFLAFVIFVASCGSTSGPSAMDACSNVAMVRCQRLADCSASDMSKRYGDRFEDSEGKQIFLEFATEEREHLELLIREYRALIDRQRRGPAARGKSRRPQPSA